MSWNNKEEIEKKHVQYNNEDGVYFTALIMGHKYVKMFLRGNTR